ncbi:MAG: SNF2-related protein [Pseudomonadota bacterium]
MLAKITDDRITLATSYDERLRVKQLPGARWSRAARRWSIPATPAYAARVAEIAEPTDDIAGLAPLLAVNAARDRRDAKAELPELTTTPWAHQREAISYLAGTDVALLDAWMGTGKTKVALDVISLRGHRRILVLCPLTVIPVWSRQREIHGPGWLRVLPLDRGSTGKRAKALTAAAAGGRPLMVVLNYESCWRAEMARAISDIPWDCLILDESHRIKAPGGRASRFCSGIRAPHRIALTGTPLPHSPLDVYGQYRALDPGIFGTSFAAFRARYAVMGGYEGKQVVGYQREDDLRRRIDSVRWCIRPEVLDLPPIHVVDVEITLAPTTQRHYDEMSADFATDVRGGTVTAANALAKLPRLQQITSGYLPTEDGAQRIGSEKSDALADILTDSAPPTVVFARFTADLAEIAATTDRLGLRYGEISGSRKEIAEFDAGRVDVLGVQIQAGGLGIDLTRSAHAVYYSLGYSLGDYRQSLARIHRPGQTRHTIVHRLIASSTVDRTIARALDAKANVVDAILADILGDSGSPVVPGQLEEN